MWEVSWRRGETATYWPQVPLTIAALLPHSAGLLNRGSWGPQPSVWSWCSLRHLIPDMNCNSNSNCDWNWLTQAVCSTWLYNYLYTHLLHVGVRICTEFNHVHRSRWYSDTLDRMHLFFSAYWQRCISWLTARSRATMQQFWYEKQSAYPIIPTELQSVLLIGYLDDHIPKILNSGMTISSWIYVILLPRNISILFRKDLKKGLWMETRNFSQELQNLIKNGYEYRRFEPQGQLIYQYHCN